MATYTLPSKYIFCIEKNVNVMYFNKKKHLLRKETRIF